MITLFFKEIRFFFSSLIGFIIISIFLLINGLMLWWKESEFNILDYGYANLDMFFIISPLLFLFFVPALSMRVFSDEYSTGTIELLITKPISLFNIVLAKFCSILFLIFLSIIPTFIYTISIYYLSEQVGNIDFASITGSYIGLFFLSSVFVSVSIFASSLFRNQIISLIIAILICGLFYFGFDFISNISFVQSISLLIEKLGISFHYSFMSKGLIKINSIVYLVSLCFLFLKLSEFTISSRKK